MVFIFLPNKQTLLGCKLSCFSVFYSRGHCPANYFQNLQDFHISFLWFCGFDLADNLSCRNRNRLMNQRHKPLVISKLVALICNMISDEAMQEVAICFNTVLSDSLQKNCSNKPNHCTSARCHSFIYLFIHSVGSPTSL